MHYKKQIKITLFIIFVLSVAITGIVFMTFHKNSVITVEFPYNNVSDISGEDMTNFILNTVKLPNADIYLSQDPNFIDFNTDWTLCRFTSNVLVSDWKNGEKVYKMYQIHIFPDDQKMNIYPKDELLSDDTQLRYCIFSEYWEALTWLPTEVLERAPEEVLELGGPDYYSMQYNPYDFYLNSSPTIHHIIYNKNGVSGDYRPSPAVMFDFWFMVLDKYQSDAYTSAAYTILYYYTDSGIKTDNKFIN